MSDAYEGTAFEPISLENAAKPMRPGTPAFHEPGGNLSAAAVNEV
jgi:hypothetical protein